ncbi:glycosyltransferase family 2 protein [Brachyspira intermedia]|uniref:glycosyltransferase family 2 protein n=1 Tax=Brachyspira intermedia TaxID=84377 RepID=UPI0030059183
MKKIIKFLFDKYDKGIYRIYKIFGIKIVTKPKYNKIIEIINKNIYDINYRLNVIESQIYYNEFMKCTIDHKLCVSILVPIYNTPTKYLKNCLDSLISQTYSNIEIILVNDASKLEENEKICLEYANKDSRIKYIKNEKSLGCGGARMVALKAATGYGIIFVDSDDSIAINACEFLIKTFTMTNADVVEFDHYWIEKDKLLQKKYHDNFLYGKDILKCLANTDIQTQIWDKAYKKELLNEIGDKLMPSNSSAEDAVATFKIMLNSKLLVHIPIPLYNYYRIETSATNEFKVSIITDIYNSITEIYEYLKENNLLEEYGSYLEKYILHLLRNINFLIKAKLVNNTKKDINLYNIAINELISNCVNNNYIDKTRVSDFLKESKIILRIKE